MDWIPGGGGGIGSRCAGGDPLRSPIKQKLKLLLRRKKKKSSFLSKRGQDDIQLEVTKAANNQLEGHYSWTKMLSELWLNIKLIGPGKFKYKRNMQKVIDKLN
jgi:hypothetical protein